MESRSVSFPDIPIYVDATPSTSGDAVPHATPGHCIEEQTFDSDDMYSTPSLRVFPPVSGGPSGDNLHSNPSHDIGAPESGEANLHSTPGHSVEASVSGEVNRAVPPGDDSGSVRVDCSSAFPHLTNCGNITFRRRK